MTRRGIEAAAAVGGSALIAGALAFYARRLPPQIHVHPVTVEHAVAFDTSRALATVVRIETDDPAPATLPADGASLAPPDPNGDLDEVAPGDLPRPVDLPVAASGVEQRQQGDRPALPVLASFDGLGAGFTGPQGAGRFGNPSDNALAVGPDHIVQIVNGGMAVFTKKGRLFDTTGKVLYGVRRSNAIFAGFGGPCETRNSGDAVVRYDQLARRWLYVLPVFQRGTAAPVAPGRTNHPGQPGQPGSPGPAGLIHAPAPPPAAPPGPRGAAAPPSQNPYSMCYAVSTTPDPLGPYYRYEFLRPLFPDYPRPAVWPDGYYVPSSTSDNFIQKHACVVERNKMLQGLPAIEQCIVIDGVNFLNDADVDGQDLPPDGAPNIVLAAGGTQLHQRFEDDGIYAWQFHVDWSDPSRTGLRGPTKIKVAPYHYLCNGQLTRCVPQRGDTTRLDSQGDKLMQRVVYRRVNGHEAILVQHSVSTVAGAGGIRWYEFRLDANRDPTLFQQGTYAPDSQYRWLASPGMDRKGNIGIGYSFGGRGDFPGQRFAARLSSDPPGLLTFHESVLAPGEAAQPRQLRWEDYATTAMDPVDDCTFWYVGDYLKRDATTYSSRIGAFRLPGCLEGTVAGSAFYDINRDGVRDGAEPGLAGWSIRYDGGRAGKVVTNGAGEFTVTLPADSVYGDVNYRFTTSRPLSAGWVRTRPERPTAAGVAPTATGFTVRLDDRDFVTGVAFGAVCSVASRGAHDAAFWMSPAGAAIMARRDSNWTRLFDSIYLADATGSRIRLPRGPAGFDTLRGWLPGAIAGTPMQQHSVRFAVAALNVVSESIDGDATIADPVLHDWPQIRALLGRGSVALGARDTTAALYATVAARLNANAATITPTHPSDCPKLP